MNLPIFAQFAVAMLMPVTACVILTLLQRNTRVAHMPETPWQFLVGIVFGLIAIYGTEAGIPLDGAMMNVRDAAPLAAGLFFGGPAGIIAGLIGGIERWLAVFWGVGSFTRVACSIATVFAGLYAAMLRKHLFDERMPGWAMAFATGIVAEVLHLLLVFLTNFDEPARASQVVQACALPMISCVAISTALSALALALLNKQPLMLSREQRGVAQIVQSRLLIGILMAFLVTIGFTGLLQTGLSQANTKALLELNIGDTEQDIVQASDSNLLELTKRAAASVSSVADATDQKCTQLADELDVSEVNFVDRNGIIVASSNPEFIGFDMSSGAQSQEFLALLPDNRQKQLVQSYQPIAYDNSVWCKYAGVALDDGFLQVGYDAQHFVDDLSSRIQMAVRNRHVGQGGGMVVIDGTGTRAASRVGVTADAANRLMSDVSNHEEGELFTTNFHGVECFASYRDAESYHVVALLPVEEANFSRDVSVLVMSFMEVLVFAALFLIIYFAIKRIVVRSIWQVNGRLGEITQGDLDVEVDVRESSEFASLSDDINKTVGALKDSIAVVQADLELAADIQANSLPDISPAIRKYTEFELLGSMEPAKEVGGDFYDFFLVDDDHLALIVADVSGKGVPAALFMMQSKTVLKMEALSGIDPDQVMLRANADLSEKNDDDMFTTAWLGVLEISTGKLVFADAGHEKLALYRNGTWELPPKPNGAIALATFGQEDYEEIAEKYRFRNHTIVLQPGDALLQYTDGVTEATDANEELFGEERLLEALNAAASPSPQDVLPSVREKISEFVQDAPQFDDITMLGLLYKGRDS